MAASDRKGHYSRGRLFRYRVFVASGGILGLLLAAALGMGWIPRWGFWAFFLLFLLVWVMAVASPGWQFFLPSITHGPRQDPRRPLCLSFDDGPDPGTEKVLDLLKEKGVKAVFFVIGEKAENRPDLIRRIHAEGHVIGNHSYRHGFFFDLQSSRSMAAEIERTNAIIQGILGVQPRWFRPPYGVTNPPLAAALRATGMQSIAWSLRTRDTVARHPQLLEKKILSRLKPGDILLLHDNQPLCHQILPSLIDRSREKGFTFVRLDQFLSLPAYV